ncbi:hypothetical protein OMP44_14625 [Pseudomonas sp. CBMAI 2609]|uniref:Uncharacterized protein n=2 Tax=Pseudomonas flavocrustae TaxID=2991719 RepID=A0ABT6IJA0_9PSED|nr:hypothetical protein [Pseudomonas sp. CBMAI 2609]
MKSLFTVSLGLFFGGVMLFSSQANAQSSGPYETSARSAEHSADVRRIEAARDKHSADVAKLDGSYRAATADAHAAAVRDGEAHRDAKLAQHDADIAKWNAKHRN